MNRKINSFTNRKRGFIILDKKQLLKTVAYEVFSQKGYKATGVSEIAERADMAVGSFYKYYPSKEAIFLDVYIAENNRIRQEMMDRIHWEAEAAVLVTQIFAWSREKISSNKILSEWYNPVISSYLHNYFASEKGKKENLFHQFLIDNFTRRLLAEGFSQKKSHEFLQVYQLFYYMDMHITKSDFPDISRTLEILAINFVKGVFK